MSNLLRVLIRLGATSLTVVSACYFYFILILSRAMNHQDLSVLDGFYCFTFGVLLHVGLFTARCSIRDTQEMEGAFLGVMELRCHSGR